MVGSLAGSKSGSPLALRPRLATGLPFTVGLTEALSPRLRKTLGSVSKTDEAGAKARLVGSPDCVCDYQLPVDGQPPLVPEQVRVTVPFVFFVMTNTSVEADVDVTT
jgi:hypothetical protein